MWDTIRIYLSLAWKNNPFSCLASLLHLIGGVSLAVFVPYFISRSLADIVTKSDMFDQHITWLIISALIAAIGNLIGFLALIRLNARLNRYATNLAFQHLLSRSIGFHNDNSGGKLVSNALEFGASSGRILVDFLFTGILPYVISSLVGIGIVFANSVEIGSVLLIVYIVTIGLTLLESHRRSKLRVERKRAQDIATANISDTIVNATAIKTFSREATEIQTNDSLQKRLLDLRLRDWTGTGLFGSVRLFTLLGLQVVFILYIARIVRMNPAVLGIGIYAFTYTLSMVNKLFELGTLLRTGEEGLLSASTMTGYILEEPEIQDIQDAQELYVEHGKVSFDNVTFTYPDSPRATVFEKLSLLVKPGEKVGLVGKSGGGKTTFTRLLLRFDDIKSGTIKIDNQDIHDVTQKSLRESIGFVPQEPLLFHRSVRENISYGSPSVTEAEVIAAAKAAHAMEFIEKLPQGLETIVGERGVKLSGGQRQRIAIARAILKDAPILVLDEATSALDSESEKLIQASLETLMKGRTSIVIAHRLSTIAKLDRIIVLDQGKIAEDGTHQELLKAGGIYASLWKHQSGGFIEE